MSFDVRVPVSAGRSRGRASARAGRTGCRTRCRATFPVSQAFPDRMTHRDPSSEHAVDFVDADRHRVFAARGGTVIEVASDFFDSGVDLVVDGPRANVVRVLHDDGTMALYAHLNWNSIRVVPGQRVRAASISPIPATRASARGRICTSSCSATAAARSSPCRSSSRARPARPVTFATGETYTAY